jgi:hypothetical protein
MLFIQPRLKHDLTQTSPLQSANSKLVMPDLGHELPFPCVRFMAVTLRLPMRHLKDPSGPEASIRLKIFNQINALDSAI